MPNPDHQNAISYHAKRKTISFNEQEFLFDKIISICNYHHKELSSRDVAYCTSYIIDKQPTLRVSLVFYLI